MTYDDLKQVNIFTCHVVATKGTIVIKADRVEVTQDPQGYQYATGTSSGGNLSYFRQKREGLDEYIEGEGERIEYDGKADVVKFINQAVIRRFRGAVLADETAGSTIVYDNVAEVFHVVGGAAAATPTNPSGRVRAVLTPREAPAASGAAAQPGATLRSSPGLGDKR